MSKDHYTYDIDDGGVVHIAGDVRGCCYRGVSGVKSGLPPYCVELRREDSTWICPCTVTDIGGPWNWFPAARLSLFAGTSQRP